ncbi:Prephenate dehydratase (PheA2) (PDB:1PHZ) [Commensalibacter communis]|uniref:prephenate dehydratase n=1 Tax=Commensalibacter communis TaxID=2972786 RepID=UPI0022FF94DE|nr:prephenate dehydratase [Commensalibacter communis]CAI3923413.1 Prephenate dehydratase (PheA2) (PDB:1PHZ) [Commensalibacter communis]CAI3935747.1 Prephenate dehydratase (PheA2) (PDB:1PHZ) [Commensalibacter communis]
MTKTKIIAFQGRPGAYSDLACRQARPGWETLPCEDFHSTIKAVQTGKADQAMLPCENNLVGRVPDIHTLLPSSDLFIVGEHFQRVEHCLIGIKGAKISDIKRLHTHPVAMGQVSELIQSLHIEPIIEFDTAGSTEIIAKLNNKEDAAIASSLAAELNGLEILQHNVEDKSYNTTRFYIVAQEKEIPAIEEPNILTTLLFKTKNIPSALYKALGGFATNNINMTRLESCMADGNFIATKFLVDVDGHIEEASLKRAINELRFYAEECVILGVYPASPYRQSKH